MRSPGETRRYLGRIHPEARVLTPEVEFKLTPNRHLPARAVRSLDPVANGILQDDWTQELNWGSEGFHPAVNLGKMREAFRALGCGVGVSGQDHDTEFQGQLHPIVEGYSWFRGYRFSNPHTKSEVFIFSGWKQPWHKGGAPDPIIYTRGNTSEEMVRKVATKYQEVLASFRKPRTAIA